MATKDSLAEATETAYRAYAKALVDQLNQVISDLKEESKTRDLSAGEIEWLRKTISDLADLPGVLPPEE
jgi:thymidylate synthase